MKYNSFAIMGPTIVGKTAAAIGLAAQFNGCLIAADSFHLYKGVKIGSWKDNASDICDIPGLLYGIYDISTPLVSLECFYMMAAEARREAIDNGFLPIFEGCNSAFAHHLSGIRNPPAKEYGPIGVVVLLPDEKNREAKIKDKIIQRLGQYLELGIVEEVKSLIEQGYSDTVLMRTLLYRYFANHINGEINLREAINITYLSWMDCVFKQIENFQKIKHSHKIFVDICDSNKTLHKLEDFVMENGPYYNIRYI